MYRILSTLFIALVLTGCSDSSPSGSGFLSSAPPTPEVDKGVNWALSAIIEWRYKDRGLFETYKVTNQYKEDRPDGTAYVYDFEADCLVRQISYAGQYGSRPGWVQALPNGDKFTSGEVKPFKGTFTVIKKGNTWYRQETVR